MDDILTSSEPPPHQLGGLGPVVAYSGKLPQRGPGHFRPQNSLQKCLITCKLLQKC